MENFLVELFNLDRDPSSDPSLERGTREAKEAIDLVLNGARSIDLTPATSYVRRLQHEMARQANLVSHSYGKEPQRRVRIFRD
jgi:predicted RNA-binding protein Jag